MACEICRMSCSLCPYCGGKSCPHLHDNDNEEKYWIYATDRKKSYLIPIYHGNSKEELKNKILDLKEGKFHNKWAKKYRYCIDLGKPEKNKKGNEYYPNYKEYYNDLIELCITYGDCNWDTCIELLYDCKEKKLYSYDSINSSITYTGKAKRMKEWKGNIKFRRYFRHN